MLKIGILGSTRGTDLQAIVDSIENGGLKGVKVEVVVSDVEDAYIVARAKKHKIDAIFVNRKDYGDAEKFNEAVLKILNERAVDLVLLIGYMRVVREPLLSAYSGRIMNIHPSLLPKYAGGKDTNVHEEVLKNKDRETGCTLHFVTANLDEGPIIMQRKVQVEEKDDSESLKKKVQKAEQEVIVKAIALYKDGKIKIDGAKVVLREN